MAQCGAIKPNGERCRVSVEPGVQFCWAHDPANAAQRRRITSKAGRSKASRELSEIKRGVKDLIEGVLGGSVDKGCGAVALQGYNTLLRAVEVEQRSELEELAREVEELKKSDDRGAA
jgi:intein/homing endonuclease